MHSFASGPAPLPPSVLSRIATELHDFDGQGRSILEISHRSPAATRLLDDTVRLVRELMQLPPEYHVLLMHGGATQAFYDLAVQLSNRAVDFVDTGYWARKAIAAARESEQDVLVAAKVFESGEGLTLPPLSDWTFRDDAGAIHLIMNETVDGIALNQLPSLPSHVPLIADMSSCILMSDVDVSPYSAIYAGAQKNLGVAGLGVWIVRDDFVAAGRKDLPARQQLRNHVAAGSRFNTPPMFAIYVCKLMLEWMAEQGGIAEMSRRTQEKAAALYRAIDQSCVISNRVDPHWRSRANVTFHGMAPSDDERFMISAATAQLMDLKGHRAVGGLRAALYNAIPIDAVQALAQHIVSFTPPSGPRPEDN